MLAFRNPSDRIPKDFWNTPKLCAYEEQNYFMGVTVLQTSVEDKTPEEIYELFKKR